MLTTDEKLPLVYMVPDFALTVFTVFRKTTELVNWPALA